MAQGQDTLLVKLWVLVVVRNKAKDDGSEHVHEHVMLLGHDGRQIFLIISVV
jgi:hypothetical protein